MNAANIDIGRILLELQDPGAYPHPVKSIRAIQTHISCVFLTGEYVYKVKKPVVFDFLNYGSVEERHRFCEREVRLNQRLCPDVYLNVVPIGSAGGRLKVGDGQTAVEWAVRMRQLRDEDMLPARLNLGAVSIAEIDRIARRIAAFHRGARGGGDIRPNGSPNAIGNMIAVTLNTMDSVSADSMSSGTREDLRWYLNDFLLTNTELLSRRVEDNRIRDCHGDLRIQNICLDPRFNEGIQIFDCIEFNDSFRYIDTAADIAYLAMDLDLAGRADLRQRLLDVYAREAEPRPDISPEDAPTAIAPVTPGRDSRHQSEAADAAPIRGSTTFARILPFYLAYRAIVRGNIAMLAARESEIPEPERAAQRELAFAAYDLARGYARHKRRRALLITVGFSGSGKSVLAREVARRLPAVRLSSDQIRKELAGADTGTALDASHYTPARRATVYEALRERAGEQLQRGENVIIDATFLDPAERDAAARCARANHADLWTLICRAPDALIRQRLRSRDTDPNASDADRSVYERQRQEYGDAIERAATETADRCIILDSSLPMSGNAHMVADALVNT